MVVEVQASEYTSSIAYIRSLWIRSASNVVVPSGGCSSGTMIVMRIAITPSLNASSRVVVIAGSPGAPGFHPARFALARSIRVRIRRWLRTRPWKSRRSGTSLAGRERDTVRLSRLIEHERHLAEEIAALQHGRLLLAGSFTNTTPDAYARYIATPNQAMAGEKKHRLNCSSPGPACTRTTAATAPACTPTQCSSAASCPEAAGTLPEQFFFGSAATSRRPPSMPAKRRSAAQTSTTASSATCPRPSCASTSANSTRRSRWRT